MMGVCAAWVPGHTVSWEQTPALPAAGAPERAAATAKTVWHWSKETDMRRMHWIAMVLLPALGGAFVFGLAPTAAQPGDPATADNPQASQVHVRYLPNVESTHAARGRAGQRTTGGRRNVQRRLDRDWDGLRPDQRPDGLWRAHRACHDRQRRSARGQPTLQRRRGDAQRDRRRGRGTRTTTVARAVAAPSPSAPVCDILFLDLGPLFLDLLGLTVDLAEVILDINAVPGAGNLLGNLLCAVAGLLDPGGLLGVIGNLQQLLTLLTQLNQLLNLLNGLFP